MRESLNNEKLNRLINATSKQEKPMITPLEDNHAECERLREENDRLKCLVIKLLNKQDEQFVAAEMLYKKCLGATCVVNLHTAVRLVGDACLEYDDIRKFNNPKICKTCGGTEFIFIANNCDRPHVTCYNCGETVTIEL